MPYESTQFPVLYQRAEAFFFYLPDASVQHWMQRGESSVAREVHDMVETHSSLEAFHNNTVSEEKWLKDRCYVTLSLK